MASKLITTHELSGTKTYITKKRNGRTKRIGKVRQFIFHPKEKRCLGFIVKRPDLLWMIRRQPLFVAFDGFDMDDGHIIVRNAPEASGNTAIKNLGVNWNYCVYWIGMPIVTADNTSFGFVGNVTLDMKTGMVESIETSTGATENALLGKRTIPASMIKGFRRGIGTAVVQTTEEGAKVENDQAILGAILVSDAAKEVEIEGGLAEQAGNATAVVTNRVSKTIDKARPTVQRVTKATGEAINEGAYLTGRQIARSTTMFSDFKKEYDKARWGEPEKSKKSSPKASSAKSSAGKAGQTKTPTSSMKLTKLSDLASLEAATAQLDAPQSGSTTSSLTEATMPVQATVTPTETAAPAEAGVPAEAVASAQTAAPAEATAAAEVAATSSNEAAPAQAVAADQTVVTPSKTAATSSKAATSKSTPKASTKAPAKAPAKASSMKLTKLGDTTASSEASKNSSALKSASTKQESTKATSTNTGATKTAATKTTVAKSAETTSAKTTPAKTAATKSSSAKATAKAATTKAATTSKTTATQTKKTYTGPKLRKL